MTDFNNKLTNLNRKIVTNKTKDLLVENELSYFRGKIILMKMVLKMIIYFSQFLSI